MNSDPQTSTNLRLLTHSCNVTRRTAVFAAIEALLPSHDIVLLLYNRGLLAPGACLFVVLLVNPILSKV